MLQENQHLLDLLIMLMQYRRKCVILKADFNNIQY